ncbi:MAG: AraC family transcriptional regulator [Pseudomonadota bacterium]
MGNSVLEDWRRRGSATRALVLPRGRHAVHAMPTSAGYERRTDRGYDWHGRKRGTTPFALIQHTLSGRGQLTFEDNNMAVESGQTMVLTFPHDNRYWLEPGDHWEFFWICMSGREALRIHRQTLAVAGPLVRLPNDQVGLLANAVDQLLKNEQWSVGRVSLLGYQCCMALFDGVLAPAEPPVSNLADPTVDRVVAYIRSHLQKPLDVGALANVAGCSRWHLSRIFVRERGISPAEFVLTEKLKHAAQLLADRSMRVAEIAEHTGFSDPNYFAKAFRRKFGASPTEFRTTGMYM